MGAAVFLADGQIDRRIDGHADMTKLIVAFRNFANAPKSLHSIHCSGSTLCSL
jgi:hypothetical protein